MPILFSRQSREVRVYAVLGRFPIIAAQTQGHVSSAMKDSSPGVDFRKLTQLP